MSKFTLDAMVRDRAGKGVARRLRAAGRIPAVIYGDGKEPVLISLDSNTINLQYRRGKMGTALGTLNLDGAAHMVVARDVALHPVSDVVEHIDFLRVSAKTRITLDIPIRVINQDKSPAIANKAVVTYATHEISVDCLASAIPEHIDVDIAGYDVGTHLHASDLKLPEGVTLHGHIDDMAILSLEMPKIMADEPAAAPVAAAVPASKEKDPAKK